jgi:hypothetical protein
MTGRPYRPGGRVASVDDNGPMEEPAADDRAAGVHLPWERVPEPVRAWGASLGDLVAARDAEGGFSPGCCTVLEMADGRSVFVKAVGAELNEDSPRIHRREGAITAALPPLPQLPRLIDTYDDGEWVGLAFEAVAGALPVHPWNDSELTVVLENLATLHEVLTPCPIEDMVSASVRERGMLSGWHSLATSGELHARLDEWPLRHLDRLVELESQALDAVSGETLIHGDLRADNMLINGATTVFVDWPHASRGAPVRDVVGWAASVALEGGPDPETLLSRYRLASWTEPEATTAVVAGVTGYFAHHALLPPPAGLPTLRAFQDAQGRVMIDWLRHRTRWP